MCLLAKTEIKNLFYNSCYSFFKFQSVRGNQSPFMNKALSKAIMERSRLRNKFLRERTDESKSNYNKQRNYCVSLVRKTKKEYFSNLNENDLTDNKKFWKIVKPYISNKQISTEKITLVENEEVVDSDEKASEIFNTFFTNAVSNLNIAKYDACDPLAENIDDPTISAIVKYRNHPSVVAIQQKVNSTPFSFQFIEKEEFEKEIKNLNPSKASQETDVPTKIMKQNYDIFAEFLKNCFNDSIVTCKFPSEMKKANVTPAHKKGSKNLKENFRPLSILPNASKLFEKCLFKQITSFFDDKFSKFQCGFRKGYSAQHCLIVMLEKWKSAIDKNEHFGAFLTDLSKAFDCLSHDILIAKLNAYGFSLPALRLVHDYLSKRVQRTRVNSVFSSWLEILFGVPQGSILGPLLFNIFLCDLFLIIDGLEIASYADDTTPYVCEKDVNQVKASLENSAEKVLNWFSNNEMKVNPSKCHVLLSSKDKLTFNFKETQIENSQSEKLLGITFDSSLSFNLHLEEMCKRASQKLNAIARLIPNMSITKRKRTVNAFFNSQFNYCPLVWMCHNRSYNNRINRLHERSLRMVYNDKQSSFEELLKKDGSVSIHIKNTQLLMIEMYKVKNNLAPVLLCEIFKVKTGSKYDFRTKQDFEIPKVRTSNFGTESLRYLGPKLWETVPSSIRELESLESFKRRIKQWIPKHCPCRLCKKYVQNIGYI